MTPPPLVPLSLRFTPKSCGWSIFATAEGESSRCFISRERIGNSVSAEG